MYFVIGNVKFSWIVVVITGECCYFKIKLDWHSHQFDIAQCVYLYWAGLFSNTKGSRY